MKLYCTKCKCEKIRHEEVAMSLDDFADEMKAVSKKVKTQIMVETPVTRKRIKYTCMNIECQHSVTVDQ